MSKEVKVFKSVACGECPIVLKSIDQIKPQLEKDGFTIRILDIMTPQGRDESLKLGLLMVPSVTVGDKIVAKGGIGSAELLRRIKQV